MSYSTQNFSQSAAGQVAHPGSGMQRLPFSRESYQHASAPLSAKRLLNFYIEQEPADARTPAALISTPGLVLYGTYGTGPILAMNGDEPGIIYIVSGTELFRVSLNVAGPALADLGYIGTPATGVLAENDLMVTIASGPNACVICVPPNAYTCTHNGPINQIGGGFPGASAVAYLDGYYIFTSYDVNDEFFISNLEDPNNYNALNFAYSDGLTNVIHRPMALLGQVWLAGEAGIQVWYDSGNLDFPFRPQPGGVIPYTVATPKSLATGDRSLFWVGLDSVVYRSIGYQAARISNHAIEALIQIGGPSNVVWGLVHTQNGHIFYCFTLEATTFAYDCSTSLWHNRSTSIDGSLPWIPSCAVLANDGVTLLGDSTNGNVYYTVPGLGTENGLSIMRQTVLPPNWGGTNRAFMNRLEIEMEVGGDGPAGNLALDWSNDGGWTWTGARQLFAGAPAQRHLRVYTTRLGSFHQRVMRITAFGYTTLYAVDADITVGQGG